MRRLSVVEGGVASDVTVADSYRRAFRPDSPPTVGIEEELILLEPETLEPAESADVTLAALGDPRFVPELRTSQLELVIQPRLTVADVCRDLARARARLVETANGTVRAIAAGTHPSSTRQVQVTNLPRYRTIGADYAWATRRGFPSGLHVHVAVADPDHALAIYNASRSWLPELSALAANSPFFEGTDSGLASTRLKLNEDFPRSGIPPAFASWDELAAYVSWGAGGGSFPDLTYLWWDLRPRPDYGTLEFRFADAQTTIDGTAAIAAICQALVAWLGEQIEAGEPAATVPSHILNENRWLAIRDGLDAQLIDPVTGRVDFARERLTELLLELEPFAAAASCADEFAHAWPLLQKNGAMCQREVAKRVGVPALVEWLADQTEHVELHEATPLHSVPIAVDERAPRDAW